MRKLTKKSKAAAVAASIALVAAGGGAAYAYWSASGAGSGSATASAGDNSVVLHTAFGPNIAPGETREITYTADNPNTSSTTVTLTGVTVTTDKAGCDVTWLPATFPTTTTTVPAGATGAVLGTGDLTFNDEAAINQDACKGAVITITAASE